MPPIQLPQVPLPDFAGPAYTSDRQDLIDAGLSPAHAITSLRTMYVAQQKKDRDARERVRQENIIARAEEEERAELLRQQQEEEEEQALKEERKKNKAKFAPIPDVPVPTEPVIVPAHVALRKLKLNQYVEMWYWTNDGLDTADRLRANMPDDSSLSLITSDDGTPSFVPSSANRSKLTPVPDEDLTFEQFGLAAVRMLSAMRECSWDPAHINMFISFWRNIETHPWRGSRIQRQQQALLKYQSTQRLHWHQVIGSTNAFSLARINEAALLITLNDLKEVADEQQARLFQEVRLSPPPLELEPC